jgi:putative membrane protein
MKTIFLIGLATVFAMLGMTGCGDGGTNANVNVVRTNTNANTSMAYNSNSGSTLGNAANSVANAVSKVTTDSPADFVKDAAQGGMAEVQLGQLALKNSQNPEIKKFAQMMVDDHGKANAELKTLAGKKNYTVPTDIGSHKSTLDKLQGLKGADFDKAYVDEMVSDHESDVKAFQKQGESGSDPELKAFAAKTATVVQKHLEAIKAIQAKMK